MKVLYSIDKLMVEHLSSICMGVVATLLVLYGYKVNHLFKRITKDLNFFVRYFLFVGFCAFGYTFLSTFMIRTLRGAFLDLSSMWRLGAIVGVFLVLAFLARMENEV